MNTKSIIFATVLFTSSAFSAPLLAQEGGVQQILSHMVKQAVSAASQEIEEQIDKVVITSGNMLSLEDVSVKGKVAIVDIASTKTDRQVKQNIESSEE